MMNQRPGGQMCGSCRMWFGSKCHRYPAALVTDYWHWCGEYSAAPVEAAASDESVKYTVRELPPQYPRTDYSREDE